jgi:hypothetical protein
MNLLSVLFSTSSNSSNPIPVKNRAILGISTLWILTILSHNLLKNQLLSINIIIISIISPIFWYSYKINSIPHKLDKFFVWTLIPILLPQTIKSNHLWLYITNINFMIICFCMSEISIIYKKYKYQLISHLAFRHLFFAWCFFLTMDFKLDYLYFIIISISHTIHNIYMYKKDFKLNLFNYLYYIHQTLSIIVLHEYSYYYLKNDYLLKNKELLIE